MGGCGEPVLRVVLEDVARVSSGQDREPVGRGGPVVRTRAGRAGTRATAPMIQTAHGAALPYACE